LPVNPHRAIFKIGFSPFGMVLPFLPDNACAHKTVNYAVNTGDIRSFAGD
jgi:hypothetical protein